jgi:hypothetical protein
MKLAFFTVAARRRRPSAIFRSKRVHYYCFAQAAIGASE